MFGLFEAPPFRDPQLGEFRRSRGKWRGTYDIGEGESVPLVLSGSRAAPDPETLRIARSLRTDYSSWRPAIERGLFEHFEPYGEALAAGELPTPPDGLPRITTQADVWKHSTVQYILIAPLSGALTVEIGFTVAWDEEHTLGARVRDGVFLELNGSVLPP